MIHLKLEDFFSIHYKFFLLFFGMSTILPTKAKLLYSRYYHPNHNRKIHPLLAIFLFFLCFYLYQTYIHPKYFQKRLRILIFVLCYCLNFTLILLYPNYRQEVYFYLSYQILLGPYSQMY
jgi:hypothetical protein